MVESFRLIYQTWEVERGGRSSANLVYPSWGEAVESDYEAF